jgi:putative effector of murein hydrolase
MGTVSTLIIAACVARLLGLPRVICSSLSLVSATAPAAIEIAPMINADSTLAAAFVIATGMIGAMLGPFLMNKIGVHSPLARGLALGTISHGQGTAQALSEGDVQGAAAGIGNALSAILTASVAPILIPMLLR